MRKFPRRDSNATSRQLKLLGNDLRGKLTHVYLHAKGERAYAENVNHLLLDMNDPSMALAKMFSTVNWFRGIGHSMYIYRKGEKGHGLEDLFPIPPVPKNIPEYSKVLTEEILERNCTEFLESNSVDMKFFYSFPLEKYLGLECLQSFGKKGGNDYRNNNIDTFHKPNFDGFIKFYDEVFVNLK